MARAGFWQAGARQPLACGSWQRPGAPWFQSGTSWLLVHCPLPGSLDHRVHTLRQICWFVADRKVHCRRVALEKVALQVCAEDAQFAFALKHHIPVVGIDTWDLEVTRLPGMNVFPVETPAEAIEKIRELLS